MKQWQLRMSLLTALVCSAAVLASEPREKQEPLYENDFQEAEPGTVPPDLMIIEGTFAVAEEEENKFLEQEGAPPIVSPVLFGPTRKDNIAVSARIYATRSGRRFPSFGIGLSGAGPGAYRLLVSPAKRAVELFKGEALQTSIPHEWKSGTWTEMYLQIRPVKEGAWKVEGQVWEAGQEAPDEWTISWEETEGLWSGKASVIGIPYSGNPIRYDEFKVLPARENP